MSEMHEATIRAFAWGDLPALVDITNAAVEFDQEDHFTTLEALRERFEAPYFNPEANCFVAELPDGRIVGYTSAELDPRVGGGWGMGFIHPAYRCQGIGTSLLQRADARHDERAAQEVAPDCAVTITRYCRDTSAGAGVLFELQGYAVARVSWFMRMALDRPLDVPPLPVGITLRPFVRERDAQAVWQAEQSFLRDNWGYVEPPFSVWEHYIFNETHDPALWLVAVDADQQIAGLCLARAWGGQQPGYGWINTLAVREDRRGRGLGSTLLRYGLRRLQERGYTEAGLEVDSENRSNAVALYERAGMRVHKRYLIYRKTVRQAASMEPAGVGFPA